MYLNYNDKGDIMELPDFNKWAQNVVSTGIKNSDFEIAIELAIKEAFYQGKALGHRKGYEDGLDNGWWKEQERSKSKRTTKTKITTKRKKKDVETGKED
jgi:hypothetical protein